MQKFYFNEAAIILTKEKSVKDACGDKIHVENKDRLYKFLKRYFAKDHSVDLYLTGYSLDVLTSDFISYFKLIHAAGGLVENTENKFLFIRRFDRWDLPKGKMEKGESPEEAAVREVEEETGVKGLEITGELPVTFHIYPHHDKLILKKTFWYRMRTDFSGELTPQQKEDITEAAWLTPEQSKQALSESYRSLRETLSSYLDY